MSKSLLQVCGLLPEPRESTLQTAIDLYAAHETLARVLDTLRYSGPHLVKAKLLGILEERHPWLFTDDSSPIQNIAELETMESYYARRLSCPKAQTDP